MARFVVSKITDGLGFGTGTISYAGIAEDARQSAERLLGSDEVLIPVDIHKGIARADDGCGDGRPVGRILTTTQDHSIALNRAKVFGGGSTMALAIMIGNADTQQIWRPLNEVFREAMNTLTQRGLTFGGHTDDMAHEQNSGCGAIDQAPLILVAINMYATQIKQAITALNISIDGLDEVITSFAKYTAHTAGNSAYSGRAVLDDMLSRAKVVKELQGLHQEKYIVLNTVPEMTVDQARFRQASNGAVQVFGVDVWRLQQIAGAFPEYGAKALLAELAYIVATAAILTAGDLPVYVIQSA